MCIRDSPIPSRRRGRRAPRILAGAAAAVALAGALLAVQALGGASLQPAASAAAVTTLNQAAALTVHAADAPLAPGQFRYVATRQVSTVQFTGPGASDCAYQQETLVEVWIPDNPDQEWLERRTEPNERTWVSCSQQDGDATGHPLPTHPQVTERRAAKGHFTGEFVGRENGGDIPLPEPGFDNPTADFLASLPRDPQELYQAIHDFVRQNGNQARPDLVFGAVQSLLATGLAPADLRAALYQAATYIPGVDVVDNAVNLDGRQGTAIGITRNAVVQEQLILDPANGDFIGERSVVTAEDHGVPAGTRHSTAVRTSVVDALGATPR